MTHDVARARSALGALDPSSDRDTWVRIGMAAKEAGLDVEDFVAWSSSASNFKSENDCRTVWRSFKPGGGITERTLFKLATEVGWREDDLSYRPAALNGNGRHDHAVSAPAAMVESIWAQCLPAPDAHPYIVRKHGDAAGLRIFDPTGILTIADRSVAGWLAVPLRDCAGALHSIQFISGDGDKLTLPGSRMGAGMFTVGKVESRAYVVEGLGQAWACWAATGKAAACSFGVGRMRTVAAELRRAHPRLELVFVADRGQERKAVADASAFGASVVTMPGEMLTNGDVNDYLVERGVEATRALLEPAQVSNFPAPLDLVAMSATEPKPPEFILPDWLPAGEVTLMGGHGGSGKSAIAFGLAAHVALGRVWCGMQPQRKRVAFLSMEDSVRVLHWRLSRICHGAGLDIAELAGSLSLFDMAHLDSELMAETKEGAITTAAYRWLAEEVMREHDVLVIDGASDAFGANENARRDVRSFVRALRRLAPEHGAVLLLAHVDKASAKSPETSQGYSGSTAWSNSVRSRWYLYREGQGEDSQNEAGLMLELQKANHAEAGAQLRFKWDPDRHLFTNDAPETATRIDREYAEEREREGILAAMRSCAISGDYVPAATTGNRTALHVLISRPEFPKNLGSKKGRFWRQIEKMRQMGLIRESAIRRKNRHFTAVLEVIREGDAPNASNA